MSRNDAIAKYGNGPLDMPSRWELLPGDNSVTLKGKLLLKMQAYSTIKFDHIEIGFTGKSTVAVFITSGAQSTVLYDKTRNFPSRKLMASLVLLGTN